MSSRCSHNMVNFGPVMAEIGSGVWVSPVNFNGSRVLAALLHGSTRSQHPANFAVLNSWIEGATYVRQGDHHVGHWPDIFSFFSSPNLSGRRFLPYFHTWCDLIADLECISEMCCTLLAENTGRKKSIKKSPSGYHRTTLSGYIFANKARTDNRKKKC